MTRLQELEGQVRDLRKELVALEGRLEEKARALAEERAKELAAILTMEVDGRVERRARALVEEHVGALGTKLATSIGETARALITGHTDAALDVKVGALGAQMQGIFGAQLRELEARLDWADGVGIDPLLLGLYRALQHELGAGFEAIVIEAKLRRLREQNSRKAKKGRADVKTIVAKQTSEGPQ